MEGIYLLRINVEKNLEIEVGSLGKIKFEKGTYTYVGSAQSGIEQRVARHKRKDKKLFWHIDYLLDNDFVEIEETIGIKGGKEKECEFANELSKKGKPVKGFGCSDCNCESHLFKIENKKFKFIVN